MSFKRDNPLINAYAQRSKGNLGRMVMMVSLSIKQPWHSIGTQMEDLELREGECKYLWGNKKATYNWLFVDRLNLSRLYHEAMQNRDDPELLMHVFLQVPGMGLAKAGFCCQLFAGSVGCIDTVNVGKFGIKPFTFSKKAKPATQRRKVLEYIEFCGARRSEALWNLWCRTIATTYPDKFKDYRDVSLKHVEYLIGTDTYAVD